MTRLSYAVLTFVAVVTFGLAGSASAMIDIYTCSDHPNGVVAPPTYGLRLDDLLSSGQYTFSFNYSDMSGSAAVTLTYDDMTGEIHIFGRAYGGKDTGAGWDATEQGWIDIDFTYRDNVVDGQNTCGGGGGDDIFVTAQSANNNGTVSLDGWGGDAVFNFSDKADGSGCSFLFDNDSDPKGNAALEADPTIFSASGWLMPPSGSRDWIFIAEMITVPVRESSLGSLKAKFNK